MWIEIKWFFETVWKAARAIGRPLAQPPQLTDNELVKKYDVAIANLTERYDGTITSLTTRYEALIVTMETRNTTFLGLLELRHAAIATALSARISEQDVKIATLEAKEVECINNLRLAHRRIDSQDLKIRERDHKIEALETRLAEAERVKAAHENPDFRQREFQQTKILVEEAKINTKVENPP